MQQFLAPRQASIKTLFKFLAQGLVLGITLSIVLVFLLLATRLTRPAQSAITPTLVADFGITSRYHNYIYQIINHPLNPNLWLVVNEFGLFKSENAGESFNPIAHPSSRVSWHPTNPQIIYNAWDNILNKTTDGGQNWQSIPKPGGTVVGLYVDQKNPNLVYYSNRTDRCDWDPWCKIYKSADAGGSFSPIADYAAENLYVSPHTSQIYYAAHIQEGEQTPYVFFQSNNQGAAWTKTYPHLNGMEASAVIIRIQEDTNGRLWAATLNTTNPNAPGQIYRSLDQGVSWENKSVGLSTSWLIRGFLIDEQGPFTLYVSLWDGGIFKSVDEGSTWQKILDVRQIPILHPPYEALSLFKFGGFLYFGTDQGQIFKLEEGPALVHPVIFIHGLGGHPSDWEEGGSTNIYFRTLKTPPYNYPNDFLYAYHYSDADGNPATYDNQGDIALISQGLKDDVDRLANLYYPGCETDCVDLVGYSLGGIVIRQYLNDHQFDHKVRTAITIASPHRGAWVLYIEDWLDALGFPGGSLRESIRKGISDLISFLGIADIDANSPAVQEIRPASDFLAQLNSIFLNNLNYSSLYGQIDAKFSLKIFFYELGKTFDLGDGSISSASASSIPTNNLTKHPFSDNAIIEFRGGLASIDGAYEYTVDLLGAEDWKYYHTNLIIQPEVVQRVTSSLASE